MNDKDGSTWLDDDDDYDNEALLSCMTQGWVYGAMNEWDINVRYNFSFYETS